jgi:hypothetical protein
MTEHDLAVESPVLANVFDGMKRMRASFKDEMDEIDPQRTLRRVLAWLDQTDAATIWRVDIGPVEAEAVKSWMHHWRGPSRADVQHMLTNPCAVIYLETTVSMFPGEEGLDVVVFEDGHLAWTTANISQEEFEIGDIYCVSREKGNAEIARSLAERVSFAFISAIACTAWRRGITA